MSVNNVLANGHCRCGQVQFEISSAPLLTFVCHCTGCQRMTGSAFSLSALYPADSFLLIRGEPVIGGLHAADLRHYFCAYCMSWLFTRPEGLEGFINVRATMLNNAGSFRPFIETCANEKLSWVQTPAVHSFDNFPSPDQFPQLLADYADRLGTPA